MKILQSFFITIIVSLIFFNVSCKKDPEIEDNYFDFKNIITLNPNKTLAKVEYYKKIDLEYSSDYFYPADTSITIIYTKNNKIYGRSHYFISNGLATHSIDTFYNNSNFNKDTVSIYNKSFKYNGRGQLTETLIDGLNKMGDSIRTDRKNYPVLYSYNDSNITKIQRGPFKCSDEFKFSNIVPAFNINNIGNDIMLIGKDSRNLISEGTYGLGCPGSPGTIFPVHKYSYKLNSDNYVTRRTEVYSINYQGTSAPPTKTVIKYEYIFK